MTPTSFKTSIVHKLFLETQNSLFSKQAPNSKLPNPLGMGTSFCVGQYTQLTMYTKHGQETTPRLAT